MARHFASISGIGMFVSKCFVFNIFIATLVSSWKLLLVTTIHAQSSLQLERVRNLSSIASGNKSSHIRGSLRSTRTVYDRCRSISVVPCAGTIRTDAQTSQASNIVYNNF